MAKKKQDEAGVNAVQKLVTLGMIAFMAYIFIGQDKPITEFEAPEEPVLVVITDTMSGTQIKSDLTAGKILIGKWEVELAPEEAPEEAPENELFIDANEFESQPTGTEIPEIIEE